MIHNSIKDTLINKIFSNHNNLIISFHQVPQIFSYIYIYKIIHSLIYPYISIYLHPQGEFLEKKETVEMHL